MHKQLQSDLILRGRKQLELTDKILKKPISKNLTLQNKNKDEPNKNVNNLENFMKNEINDEINSINVEKNTQKTETLIQVIDTYPENLAKDSKETQQMKSSPSKSNKNTILEPVLKIQKEQQIKKSKINPKTRQNVSKSPINTTKKKENLVDPQENASPIQYDKYNETMNVQNQKNKLDEYTGDFESSKEELKVFAKRITAKTLTNIKNLIKPQEKIVMICMAFIGLFGEDFELDQEFYSNRQVKEWSSMQKYFENTENLLNLISYFEELVETNLINEKNVKYTMDLLLDLSSKQKNNMDENLEFTTEIIAVLADFLNAACKYYHNFKINELKISPIKPPFSCENPLKSPDLIAADACEKVFEKNKRKTIENPPINEKKAARSVSSNSKSNNKKLLEARQKEIDIYLNKKKITTKKNKLERIMNLKVKKPSVSSALRDYLNKSSEFQNSFSSKRKKNDNSLNSSNQSFYDEIKKEQLELKKIEADKSKMLAMHEKKKKKDAELEELQMRNQTFLKEKENENKIKKILETKNKQEKNEIQSFRRDLLLESKKQKNFFEHNLRKTENPKDLQEKEKELSIKREKEMLLKQKKREESEERKQHIQFLRDNKKKIKEKEIENYSKEYQENKNVLLKMRKKEIQKMKENLENELFQTLQIIKKDN